VNAGLETVTEVRESGSEEQKPQLEILHDSTRHAWAAPIQQSADATSYVYVQTYPQLVEYLAQEGGPGTTISSLPLFGANKVVYRV
jgi:hypothetical protein